MKKVGVLALQGDFEAHSRALERAAGAEPVLVRTAARPRRPGWTGDSRRREHHHAEAAGRRGPVRAAGRVRPAARPSSAPARAPSCWRRDVSNPAQESLGLMDLTVERNAYGRQIDSRVAQLDAGGRIRSSARSPGELEAVFIRAPIIRRVGPRGPRAGALSRRPRAGGTGPPPGGDLSSGAHRGFAGARALPIETVSPPIETRAVRVHRQLLPQPDGGRLRARATAPM